MELLHLKYFCKVARLQHMTHAAEELHIAQPALSKSIKMLETELGVSLFDRTGRYITLNEYGRTFLKHVEQALQSLEDATREVHDLATGTVGYIKLAFPVGSHIVPNLITAFREKYPDIHFQLLQHYEENVKPEFDLCISSLPQNYEHMQSIPLVTEEIFLAVPKGHALADRSSIALSEAAHEHFIGLRHGHSLRETTDDYCHMAGFKPKHIFESDDPATVRGLIRAGQGVAFIPAVSWEGSTGPDISLVPIHTPICQRTIGISWRGDHYLSRAALVFREFTIEFFGNASDL